MKNNNYSAGRFFRQAGNRIRIEADRRPMAAFGLFLLLVALLRLPHAWKSVLANSLPEGRIVLTGRILEIENKENSVQFILKYGKNRVLVSSQDRSVGAFAVGDEVRVTGICRTFRPAGNPGQFDSRTYYAVRGIASAVFADETVRTSIRRPISPRERLRKLRNRLLKLTGEFLEEPYGGVAKAILFGDSGAVDASLKELYRRNGIAHILAVSGLHLSFFGRALYLALRRLFRKPLPAALLAAILLFPYVMLTGCGYPAVRAYLFFLLASGAEAAGRGYDRPTAWMLSLGVLTSFRPLSLLDIGFLLSFAVSGSFLFSAEVCRVLELRRESRKVRHLTVERLADSLLSACILQLFLIPLQLRFFFLYPLYSMPVNAVIVPLMSILLGSLAIGLAAAQTVPLLLRYAGYPAVFLLKGYTAVCRLAESLPYAFLVPGQPSVFAVFFSYGCFLAALVFFCRFLLEKARRKVFAAAFAILFLIIGTVPMISKKPAVLEITVQDIGQGDSILIRTKSGSVFLVDGGSSDGKEPGKNRLLPFLRAVGVQRIDILFLTHMDNDHINAAEELLTDPTCGIEFGKLVLTKQAAETDTGKRLILEAGEAGTRVGLIQKGDTLQAGEAAFSCLWPEAEETEDSNQTSMVLLVATGRFGMLLTGDLEGEAEEKAAAGMSREGIKAQVLKVGHHGSEKGTGEAFLAVVRPKDAVISCGYRNRYGHPSNEVLTRLSDAGVRVFRTDRCGAVRIETDGRSYSVLTYLKEK